MAEFILQEVEQGRADIPLLCFNCASPELCNRAVEALPQTTMRQRLRNARIALGVYPNMCAGTSKRQRSGFDAKKTATKIEKREDITEEFTLNLCDQWTAAGVTHIGGCCGSTPEDIEVIAQHLKRRRLA